MNSIDIFYDYKDNKILLKGKKNKLMTITGVDNTNKNSYICSLFLLKYEDNISLEKVFKYKMKFLILILKLFIQIKMLH